MLSIKLTHGRTSTSIDRSWTVDAPRCNTLTRQFTAPTRPSVRRNTKYRTFRLWQLSLMKQLNKISAHIDQRRAVHLRQLMLVSAEQYRSVCVCLSKLELLNEIGLTVHYSTAIRHLARWFVMTLRSSQSREGNISEIRHFRQCYEEFSA